MRNLIWVVSLILAFFAGYLTSPKRQHLIKEEAVAVTVDTTHFETPDSKDSVVLRYEYIPVPKYAYKDSIQLIKDTVFDTIQIPIVQKTYSDSTYKIWISGYKPSLDSIEIYSRSVVVNNTIVKPLNKRWGIGVQAGVELKSGKVEPYIGIGVSYNFLCF